ncbi:hypothetical protein JG687_00009779 [Phytophthora cactorum]|uniref:RxLR effector PexRD54 WY domain-containing protein n=1 Tax=Phytophthora cactorum TaxID=29920 RepID=A0A8T1U8Z4_9STRA|nr:hypothetical protein PC120_g15635 [Phytophthora cactorum]KAG3055252.1 hypothetical protein PC121_g15873 [Phytophthora cactorum]KAG3170121.1 hypothetical protein PC128_g18987 [Phytophthora cactorum]KAG6957762.1 hypothetical protein JG687_00009779 [Phytophthora cactorum]
MATPCLTTTRGSLNLTKRHLRGDYTDGEERLNLKSLPGLDKVKSLFKSKITPDTLMKWDKKNKSPDYAFKKFNLHKAEDKLFDNPDFLVWVAYTRAVRSNPEDAMLTTLKSKYEDDVLASMLIQAKNVKKTKDIATSLQRAQLNTWLRNNKSSQDVFKILRVRGSAGDSANRLLWKQYIREQNELRKANNA